MTDLDVKTLRQNVEAMREGRGYQGVELYLIDAILALIDRLEAAERERDRLREALGRYGMALERIAHPLYDIHGQPAEDPTKIARAALAPQSEEGK